MFNVLFLRPFFFDQGAAGAYTAADNSCVSLPEQDKKMDFNPHIAFTGVLIFAAVAFPWYILVMQKYSGLLSYFIKNEIIGRIVHGVHSRNPGLFGSLKVYPHTLLLGSLPWAYFWFTIAWKTRPQVFTAAWWHLLRARNNALFLTLWFGISLFLLSAANSRLPLYVLPLFVPSGTCHGPEPVALLSRASRRNMLLTQPAGSPGNDSGSIS